MDKTEFTILLRCPEYPVIVVSTERLYSAIDIEGLAIACMSSSLVKGETIIKAIDSTGSEFWYMPDKKAVSPGFVAKKWSKLRIIELFNNSSNAKNKQVSYSTKSISNRRLAQIVFEICRMLGNA